MQCTSMIALTLVLAFHCSDGLVIVSKGRTNTSARVQGHKVATPDPHPALLAQRNSNMQTRGVDQVLVRPSAALGTADTVSFGLHIMNFYGTDLNDHTVALDIVLSLRWKDPRVIRLLPFGLDQLTMAWSQALDKVWMPGIVVTNRDIEKYEIISSAVTIFRSGEVQRVERAQTRVMKKFDLEAYPFDTQNLEVKVASSKYMYDELVIAVDNKTCGIEEQIFGLYDVLGWHTEVYQTNDGDLKKSRGLLDVKVKRQLGKYIDDHLVPTFIVLTISWAVFYFPFANPFITPRLALSILALLTFTNLILKSAKLLPGAAPFNWNDLFNQQIQTFMFITIVFNICTEIMFHQFQKEELARRMNRESKVCVPGFSIINIIIILGSARYGWMSLKIATWVTKATGIFLVAAYGGYVYLHWYKEKKALEEAAAAKDQWMADGEADGDDCGM